MQDIANDILQVGYSKLLRVSTVQYTTNATNNLPKNVYFNFFIHVLRCHHDFFAEYQIDPA